MTRANREPRSDDDSCHCRAYPKDCVAIENPSDLDGGQGEPYVGENERPPAEIVPHLPAIPDDAQSCETEEPKGQQPQENAGNCAHDLDGLGSRCVRSGAEKVDGQAFGCITAERDKTDDRVT